MSTPWLASWQGHGCSTKRGEGGRQWRQGQGSYLEPVGVGRRGDRRDPLQVAVVCAVVHIDVRADVSVAGAVVCSTGGDEAAKMSEGCGGMGRSTASQRTRVDKLHVLLLGKAKVGARHLHRGHRATVVDHCAESTGQEARRGKACLNRRDQHATHRNHHVERALRGLSGDREGACVRRTVVGQSQSSSKGRPLMISHICYSNRIRRASEVGGAVHHELLHEIGTRLQGVSKVRGAGVICIGYRAGPTPSAV